METLPFRVPTFVKHEIFVERLSAEHSNSERVFNGDCSLLRIKQGMKHGNQNTRHCQKIQNHWEIQVHQETLW